MILSLIKPVLYLVLLVTAAVASLAGASLVVIPEPYDGALRNPMKGFTGREHRPHPWATLHHFYIKWNELEDAADDGIEKILAVTNEKLAGIERKNGKAIVRVYLHYSGDRKFWPSDMTTDDYTSEQFQRRLVRLVQKLGFAWDSDPRIAFIEMGIFGKWGEHHGPSPGPELKKIAGDAFAAAFRNKQVSVRHAWDEFTDNPVGQYWDSWAHYSQMGNQGREIRKLVLEKDFHLKHYIGGEVAYDWGDWEIQPGRSPTDSVAVKKHRDFIINSIRWLHGTQLRWISGYDQSNPEAAAGAEAIQKAFGYRFILEAARISMEAGLSIAIDVKNEGSAPFYYDWPIEVALLAPETLEPVWRSVMRKADIRTWHPGARWTEPEWTPVGGWKKYEVNPNWAHSGPTSWGRPPQTYTSQETFDLSEAPSGVFVLSLAVLDPAGKQPSLRFATSNYIHGGRHPIALVDTATNRTGPLPADFPFQNPATDGNLRYAVDIDEAASIDAYENLAWLPLAPGEGPFAERARQRVTTLTDQQERVLEVEILDAEKEHLLVRRQIDREVVKVPVKMLIEADRAFAAYLEEHKIAFVSDLD